MPLGARYGARTVIPQKQSAAQTHDKLSSKQVAQFGCIRKKVIRAPQRATRFDDTDELRSETGLKKFKENH
jgi:hypothetical protein